jgi:hypothetical protein
MNVSRFGLSHYTESKKARKKCLIIRTFGDSGLTKKTAYFSKHEAKSAVIFYCQPIQYLKF